MPIADLREKDRTDGLGRIAGPGVRAVGNDGAALGRSADRHGGFRGQADPMARLALLPPGLRKAASAARAGTARLAAGRPRARSFARRPVVGGRSGWCGHG